ncbi:MAG: TIM barrel protein [Clostridia bacterium]|nr:TIM barrel protein [Clostridia bacterium]
MNVRFGPGGNPEDFYKSGGKSSLEMPRWLSKMGLDAYEYECGRGVKISDDACAVLKAEAEKYGIALSVHSPYYINLASPDPEKQEKSIGYIMSSVRAAKLMGADRVVVHMGAAGKITRREGVELSKALVLRALSAMRSEGLDSVRLCIETMGKLNQLGDETETANVCSVDEALLPAVDFGHLNARSGGKLVDSAAFEESIKIFENKIGAERTNSMHIHFSKIEYTHMGEKRHLTFEDTLFGPDFEPLAEVIAKRGMTPRVICESAGTQGADALVMKKIMEEKLS